MINERIKEDVYEHICKTLNPKESLLRPNILVNSTTDVSKWKDGEPHQFYTSWIRVEVMVCDSNNNVYFRYTSQIYNHSEDTLEKSVKSIIENSIDGFTKWLVFGKTNHEFGLFSIQDAITIARAFEKSKVIHEFNKI